MKFSSLLIQKFLNKAVLIHKERLSQHTFHLKLYCRQANSFDYIPGQHLKILVSNDKTNIDLLRTYSIWQLDTTEKTIDLAICTNSNGPGAKWVNQVAIGDYIFLSKPKGRFTLDHSVNEYLFIGDNSALAHFYAIRRAIPSTKKIRSIIYSNNGKDLFPDIDGTLSFDLYELFENPLNQVKEILAGNGVESSGLVYLGGDGRLCIGLNRYFRNQLLWDTKLIKTKPFWLPNKKGLD